MRLNKNSNAMRCLGIVSATSALMLAAVPSFAVTLFVTSERDNTVTVLDAGHDGRSRR